MTSTGLRRLLRIGMPLLLATIWAFLALPMTMAIAVLFASAATLALGAVYGGRVARGGFDLVARVGSLALCGGGLAILWRSGNAISRVALYGGLAMILVLAALTAVSWRRSPQAPPRT